jgi:hypothetical protein
MNFINSGQFFKLVLVLELFFHPTLSAESALPSSPIVIQTSDCFVRFQTPLAGQTTDNAFIRALSWANTVQDVTSTIQDFSNIGGNNAQLWRAGNLLTWMYAGYMSCSSIPMIPQDGLNLPQTAVTIILPSGVAKLQIIGPDISELDQTTLRAVRGIFGLQGTLLPVDYAYCTGASIKGAIIDWQVEVGRRFSQPPDFDASTTLHTPSDGYFLAVRGDGVAVHMVMDGLVT